MSMIYFYESNKDLATRGQGVLGYNGDTEDMWGPVSSENITNMDIADLMDLIGPPASDQVAYAEYEEYRDEREDSSRLADRYGC